MNPILISVNGSSEHSLGRKDCDLSMDNHLLVVQIVAFNLGLEGDKSLAFNLGLEGDRAIA